LYAAYDRSLYLGASERIKRGDTMDIEKELTELQEEHERIEEAVLSLERLACLLGRHGAWMPESKKRQCRPPGSQNKPTPPET
jgi:hypothetical protein